MRILQINHVYKNGGSTGRIVYDLKNIIEAEKDEAYVAFGYEYKRTNDSHTYKIETIPELKVNILKTRIFAEHGFYNTVETKRLIKWINGIKPDVIHLHNIHGHYINIAILFDYIKENNIPVVWTLHDCWPFTGWCAYFDFVQCRKWITGCSECPSKHDYPYSWFLDRSKENYKRKKECFLGVKNLTVVTPSNWLACLVKQSFLKEYPVKVINNGIDITTFHPVESDFRERYKIFDRKIILAVSMGLEKRKGIKYIFNLADMIDDKKAVVVIVGVGKEQMGSVPSNIICIEKTSNVHELAEAYSAADVFINPTLEDNFPTTNLEAMACGTPVVTFDTGGSPESVREKCGRIVEKGNMEEFYSAVMNTLDNKSYSDTCIQNVAENYEKKKCFNKYIELYRQILKQQI